LSRSNEARKARLLAAAFAEHPIFRQGNDAHVRDYRRYVGRETFATYHSDPSFRSAYEARQTELRAMPMPAWGGRHG
jgi:hypothetical protein